MDKCCSSCLGPDVMCSRTEELISDRQQSSVQGLYLHSCSPALQHLLCTSPGSHVFNKTSSQVHSGQTTLLRGPAPAPLTSQSAQSHRKFKGCFFLTEINLFSQKPDRWLLGGFQQKRFPHCSLKRHRFESFITASVILGYPLLSLPAYVL